MPKLGSCGSRQVRRVEFLDDGREFVDAGSLDHEVRVAPAFTPRMKSFDDLIVRAGENERRGKYVIRGSPEAAAQLAGESESVVGY